MKKLSVFCTVLCILAIASISQAFNLSPPAGALGHTIKSISGTSAQFYIWEDSEGEIYIHFKPITPLFNFNYQLFAYYTEEGWVNLDCFDEQSLSINNNNISTNQTYFLRTFYFGDRLPSGSSFLVRCSNQGEDPLYYEYPSDFVGDPGEQTGVYYIPYSPADNQYMLGFGVSGLGNANDVDVTIDYYSNSGVLLDSETRSVPADAHASFMRGPAINQNGWAMVTSPLPLYGMALLFIAGAGEPMFDMDFKSGASTNLTIAHIDTSGSWKSKAMLANPNANQADVTLTLHPTGGGATQTANLTIPAMGSVQYDLSTFNNASGSVQISATESLVGFLLYDGRAYGTKWLGGLSIVPTR